MIDKNASRSKYFADRTAAASFNLRFIIFFPPFRHIHLRRRLYVWKRNRRRLIYIRAMQRWLKDDTDSMHWKFFTVRLHQNKNGILLGCNFRKICERKRMTCIHNYYLLCQNWGSYERIENFCLNWYLGIKNFTPFLQFYKIHNVFNIVLSLWLRTIFKNCEPALEENLVKEK